MQIGLYRHMYVNLSKSTVKPSSSALQGGDRFRELEYMYIHRLGPKWSICGGGRLERLYSIYRVKLF